MNEPKLIIENVNYPQGGENEWDIGIGSKNSERKAVSAIIDGEPGRVFVFRIRASFGSHAEMELPPGGEEKWEIMQVISTSGEADHQKQIAKAKQEHPKAPVTDVFIIGTDALKGITVWKQREQTQEDAGEAVSG